MSLIDEALRRAQDAQRPGSTGPPGTPAPMPDRRRSGARAASRIAIALTVTALMGAAFFFRRANPAVSPSVSRAAGRQTVQPAPAETRASQARGPIPPARSTRPKISASGRSGVDSARRGPPASRSTPIAARPEERADSENPSRRTYVGDAPTPGGGKIELGGIVYSEDHPVALLNGRIFSPGGVIEGFTVVAIAEDRVELRNENWTIFLTLR